MQKMLKTRKDEEDDTSVAPSAFHQAGHFGKSPTLGGVYGVSHRDSGYGTDFSPASNTSTSRRFTYDSDVDLVEGFDDLDISHDNDVFSENAPILECNETDDTDREVEGLLNEETGPRHQVSQPIHIKRPSAPIPTPEDKTDEDDDIDTNTDSGHVSEPWCHTNRNLSRDRHMTRNRFRPIVSRSVGTQTPSPHGQIITEAMTSVNALGRFQPYARGRVLTRLRLRSESEDTDCKPPLPDIVPMSRDRSISLPDVPSFRRQEQEQEVGRELRRISDEFNSSFSRRRESVPYRHASSFPLVVNIDFHAYWTSLRRILSSSPIFQPRTTDSSDDGKFRKRSDSHR